MITERSLVVLEHAPDCWLVFRPHDPCGVLAVQRDLAAAETAAQRLGMRSPEIITLKEVARRADAIRSIPYGYGDHWAGEHARKGGFVRGERG